MTEPQYMRITGYPRAWSPAIASTLVGTPMVVEVKSKDDFDKYRGKLRGAIVMNGKPEPVDIGVQPEAKRFTAEELKKQEGAIDPADVSGNAPKSYWDEEQHWKILAKQTEIDRFFAGEGIALLVEPSPISEDVRIGGFYDRVWRPAFPGFVIAREHYGRIVRMLDRKQPVKVAFTLAAQFAENVDGFNALAEIPGTDPVLKSEVVMLGGHLDSWHAGTGATDNAAGCAVAMEAVRILQTIGARPRRTIDALGLPGFQFIQDPLNYDSKVHHSNLDVFEEAMPDDLKQASVILASFVYYAAMRDAMLPRKPLPRPHTETN